MPDEPYLPSDLRPVTPLSGPFHAAGPISLEPASKLPESLREGQMLTPRAGAMVGALAGSGPLSDLLQALNGPVALPAGKAVDAKMFEAIVSSAIVLGH